MQLPVAPAPNVLVDVLRSPPVYIIAFAALVRWVVAPAVTNYMRYELKAELSELKNIPNLVTRLEMVEQAIERLSHMPEALARIEGRLERLTGES